MRKQGNIPSKSLKKKTAKRRIATWLVDFRNVSKLGEPKANKFLHMCTKKYTYTTRNTSKMTHSNDLSALSEKEYNKLYFKRTKNRKLLYLFKRVW